MIIFKKSLSSVLNTLEKTITDLCIVAEQQHDVANEQSNVMARASAAQQEANEAKDRANRIATKLTELLK